MKRTVQPVSCDTSSTVMSSAYVDVVDNVFDHRPAAVTCDIDLSQVVMVSEVGMYNFLLRIEPERYKVIACCRCLYHFAEQITDDLFASGCHADRDVVLFLLHFYQWFLLLCLVVSDTVCVLFMQKKYPELSGRNSLRV